MIKVILLTLSMSIFLHAQTYVLKDLKTQKEVSLSVRQEPSTRSIHLNTGPSASPGSEAVLRDSRELIKVVKVNDYFVSILFKVKTSWEQNDLTEALFVVHEGRLVNALLLDRESGYSRKAPTTSGGSSFNFLKYENLVTIQTVNGQWVADVQEVWNEENLVDGKGSKKSWKSSYKLSFSDKYFVFYNCIISSENIKLFDSKIVSHAPKQDLYVVLLRASQRMFDGHDWSQFSSGE